MCLQCWTFKCIQSFRFLQPKITDHPFYSNVVKAGRSAHANQTFMVCTTSDPPHTVNTMRCM